MNNNVINLSEFESFSLRIAPGEYASFPVVNNKGLFVPFVETDEDFNFRLVTDISSDVPVHGIYKKSGKFCILVCAFSTHEEINEDARVILNNHPEIKFQILPE